MTQSVYAIIMHHHACIMNNNYQLYYMIVLIQRSLYTCTYAYHDTSFASHVIGDIEVAR